MRRRKLLWEWVELGEVPAEEEGEGKREEREERDEVEEVGLCSRDDGPQSRMFKVMPRVGSLQVGLLGS